MTVDMRESPTAPVRVLIVDDHEVVRRGIRAMLAESPGFEVVGEAENGQDAVSRAKELRPNVILMDLLMPVMDGIEATRQITASQPETGVLVLTSFATDEDLFPALKAGALGYLLKDASPAELARGIRRVARGESSLDPAMARRLLQKLSSRRERRPARETLTAREVDVLRLVAEGLSNQAIADRLSVTERTARTHMGHILAKLQMTSRTQAALYAVQEGFIGPRKPRDNGE